MTDGVTAGEQIYSKALARGQTIAGINKMGKAQVAEFQDFS